MIFNIKTSNQGLAGDTPECTRHMLVKLTQKYIGLNEKVREIYCGASYYAISSIMQSEDWLVGKKK